jgi:hypothetical protein
MFLTAHRLNSLLGAPPALARIAEDKVLPASHMAPYLASPSASRQLTHRSPASTHTRDGASRLGGERRFSGRDDKTEGGYSTASNRSVAESVIQRAASRKGRF